MTTRQVCVRAAVRIAVVVLALASGLSQRVYAQQMDPRITQLVSSVSEERLSNILRKLQSFETRSSLSSLDSTTRGAGAAREWILQ